MPHSSLAIANEFIERASKPGQRALTQMQVQKLVYLAHGWHLGAFDAPLIDEPIEAWKFGPVIRPLYSALSRYGSSPIDELIRWGEDTILLDSDDDGVAREELGDSDIAVIDMVWESYGTFPAFKLSALTHEPGTPWSQTYQEGYKRVIPNEVIKGHFKELLAAS